jgi:hypothetical protein
MSPDLALRRFVHALQAGATRIRQGHYYIVPQGKARASAAPILHLIGSGVLGGNEKSCHANAETRSWLRRAHLDADPFAAQHRVIAKSAAGVEMNHAESPLSRLGIAAGGEAFLERHHVEAGERVRRLVERAGLQPRLTMTYSVSGNAGNGRHSAADISDLAADARRDVASIYRLLPRDCAGVVIDICGLLKGLQQVERERGWPRRSAKLVLRIGLEQLAKYYGLAPFARGRAVATQRSWMDEEARPLTFE